VWCWLAGVAAMWFGVGEPPALILRGGCLICRASDGRDPGDGECVGGVGKNL
jgi:hypothetical protein